MGNVLASRVRLPVRNNYPHRLGVNDIRHGDIISILSEAMMGANYLFTPPGAARSIPSSLALMPVPGADKRSICAFRTCLRQ